MFLGPAAAPKRAGGRRYAAGLAARSALRRLRLLRSGLRPPAPQRWALSGPAGLRRKAVFVAALLIRFHDPAHPPLLGIP
ncbi:hypothetical protein SGRA_1026 [Saprospira grandis str. Lewin]|uniref:Uncharacterized protein n=1 Tax=Saprospira grandis (strain Lewin) TaxID=984262 RepID=H6L3B4_SAPGL|nr:hypothetical protein SGRA_1026 [Saprospira grandis str. Lewin]